MYTEPSLTYFTRNTVGLSLGRVEGLAGAGMTPSGACASTLAGHPAVRQNPRTSMATRGKIPMATSPAFVKPDTDSLPPVIESGYCPAACSSHDITAEALRSDGPGTTSALVAVVAPRRRIVPARRRGRENVRMRHSGAERIRLRMAILTRDIFDIGSKGVAITAYRYHVQYPAKG